MTLRNCLLCTAFLLGLAAPAHAQKPDLYAAVGATWASKLYTDEINATDITVKQSIAPTIRAGAALPIIGDRYGLGVEAGFAWGSYKADDAGENTTTDLGNLSTLSITANLDGPLVQRLRWRAGIGAIGYLKTDDGIFQQGGPWKPLYMVGLDYRVPLWTKWDLLISGRVDGHSFTTDELKAQGFTNSQGVQRVFLGVGLAGVRK